MFHINIPFTDIKLISPKIQTKRNDAIFNTFYLYYKIIEKRKFHICQNDFKDFISLRTFLAIDLANAFYCLDNPDNLHEDYKNLRNYQNYALETLMAKKIKKEYSEIKHKILNKAFSSIDSSDSNGTKSIELDIETLSLKNLFIYFYNELYFYNSGITNIINSVMLKFHFKEALKAINALFSESFNLKKSFPTYEEFFQHEYCDYLRGENKNICENEYVYKYNDNYLKFDEIDYKQLIDLIHDISNESINCKEFSSNLITIIDFIVDISPLYGIYIHGSDKYIVNYLENAEINHFTMKSYSFIKRIQDKCNDSEIIKNKDSVVFKDMLYILNHNEEYKKAYFYLINKARNKNSFNWWERD